MRGPMPAWCFTRHPGREDGPAGRTGTGRDGRAGDNPGAAPAWRGQKKESPGRPRSNWRDSSSRVLLSFTPCDLAVRTLNYTSSKKAEPVFLLDHLGQAEGYPKRPWAVKSTGSRPWSEGAGAAAPATGGKTHPGLPLSSNPAEPRKAPASHRPSVEDLGPPVMPGPQDGWPSFTAR